LIATKSAKLPTLTLTLLIGCAEKGKKIEIDRSLTRPAGEVLSPRHANAIPSTVSEVQSEFKLIARCAAIAFPVP
jgi:hypothetical protein